MSFLPTGERVVSVGAGALEVLSNGLAVVTEDYVITDYTGSEFQESILAGPVMLKGDSVNFSNILRGTASSTSISLTGSIGSGLYGDRELQGLRRCLPLGPVPCSKR
jgi:hypothetical protein